jgi:hypothetical protein
MQATVLDATVALAQSGTRHRLSVLDAALRGESGSTTNLPLRARRFWANYAPRHRTRDFA